MDYFRERSTLPRGPNDLTLGNRQLHAHPDLCDRLSRLVPRHPVESAYGVPVLAFEGVAAVVACGTDILPFRRWQRNGTWHQVFTRLQSLADAKGRITWDLSVDSTVCRAHQHAAGARRQGELQKEPPGGVFTEPEDHGLGRSRGGFTTKLHLTVEQGQKPMSIVITAGQRGDSPQFEPVLDKARVPRIGPGRPRVRPNRVRADKAYASRQPCRS
ncbi:transposase [Kitasatospora sp. NPDC058406]|uniref:transposase n=1 Tax=Kitasatospora sp. NPDC058406 TaxID=3346483 RepID=UPI003651FEB7